MAKIDVSGTVMRRLAKILLFTAVLFQAGLTVYYYKFDEHRLAGIDYLAFYYPQTSSLFAQWGAISPADMQRRRTDYDTPFHPEWPVSRNLDAGSLHALPFVLLPLRIGLWVYLLANLAATFAAVWWLMTGVSFDRRALWTALIVASAPVHYNLLHAHSSGIYLLLLVAAVHFSRKKPILAGLALSLLLIHKLYLAPLAALILPFVPVVAFAAIGWFGVLSMVGYDYVLSLKGLTRLIEVYLGNVTAVSGGTVSHPTVIHLHGGLHECFIRMFQGADNVRPMIHAPWMVTGLYLVAAALIFGSALFLIARSAIRKTEGGASWLWGFSIVTATLISPSTGDYMFLYVVPALTLAARPILAGTELPVRRHVILVVAALLLLAQSGFLRYPSLYPDGVLPPILNPELIGMILLWAWYVRESRRPIVPTSSP